MKKQIKSAELERYNANSRGVRTGDCVKRSISLAFDISYNEVSKLLNQKMKDMHWDAWNKLPVFKKVIEDLGGRNYTAMKESITVNDFADTSDPSDIYLILCGKKLGETSHLVCIRNGKVWDSWDSRNYIVTNYWVLSGSDRKQVRDSTSGKQYMLDLAENYVRPIVHDEIIRYADKKGIKFSSVSSQSSANNYQIVVTCSIKLDANDIVTKSRSYSFKIVLVIEPTLTEPEITAFIDKYAKQKTYDKMWSINEQEKKLRESYEVMKDQGQQDKPMLIEDNYLTPQERKFFNSLPGWAKPLIKWVRVYKPGQYHNSYIIQMNKLPGDNLENHAHKRHYNFETWTADEMRNILDEYKLTGRVEGIDYYYDDEF